MSIPAVFVHFHRFVFKKGKANHHDLSCNDHKSSAHVHQDEWDTMCYVYK